MTREAFLAQLYSEPALLARFLVDPHAQAARAGLSSADVAALAKLDRVGLELAIASFERKRAQRPAKPARVWRKLFGG